MAKFSVWRDEDEEEEDEEEEFYVRSPKRRRTYDPPIPPSSSASAVHHHQPINHDDDDDDHEEVEKSGGEIESTARTNNSGGGGGPVSVILSDPDVLDCSICFEPLTIPVFQCDNGHIACSSCCNNLSNKCPSCCGKIGNNRCRAIEKVVESVKVSCCYVKDGCNEIVSYCKKHEHEEKCSFAPCLCPFTNCLFRASPRKLSLHICRNHSSQVVRFRYNSVFSTSLSMDENLLVLQEEKDDILFILSHGNSVAVSCINSSLSKEGLKYDIVLRRGCSTLKFQSSTRCTSGQLSERPSADYFLVPGYFYHASCRLKLEICIWSKDASHVGKGVPNM